MIIKIYNYQAKPWIAGDPFKYSAFLISDDTQVCVVPAHESLSYVSAMASAIKDLLVTKVYENIKIEYPPTTGEDVAVVDEEATAKEIKRLLNHKTPACEKNPAFESKLKYTDVDTSIWAGSSPTEKAYGELYLDHINTCVEEVKNSRQRSREGLPFDSRGTMSGIRLQARNVAERANLGDYSSFVGEIVRLGETLQEDLEARYDDEKAREELHAKFHARLQRTYTVEQLGVLLEQSGDDRFVELVRNLADGK